MYITNVVQMLIIYLYEKMCTGSLIILLVRKYLRVSISRGKPSIHFLLNIRYVVYVVYVAYVVYVVYAVYVVYVVYDVVVVVVVVYFVYAVYVVHVVYVAYVVHVVYVVKPNMFYVRKSHQVNVA